MNTVNRVDYNDVKSMKANKYYRLAYKEFSDQNTDI